MSICFSGESASLVFFKDHRHRDIPRVSQSVPVPRRNLVWSPELSAMRTSHKSNQLLLCTSSSDSSLFSRLRTLSSPLCYKSNRRRNILSNVSSSHLSFDCYGQWHHNCFLNIFSKILKFFHLHLIKPRTPFLGSIGLRDDSMRAVKSPEARARFLGWESCFFQWLNVEFGGSIWPLSNQVSVLYKIR